MSDGGHSSPLRSVDVALVGGGAAGLATAIFAARHAVEADLPLRIAILDGAKKLGTKILVSGGGRCNVTNQRVTADDYWGGSRNTIKKVLAALPVARTIEFFQQLGVPLHLEETGKYFPNSNSAKTVLSALLDEVRRLGVAICADTRVTGVHADDARGFVLATSQGEFAARRVVLATGGQSLPKSGSDGFGYQLARSLGHTVVPCTPALAPLLLDGDFHVGLSGLAMPVEIVVHVQDARPERIAGSLLWTHFGISGPAAMNASRVWHRARLEGRDVRVTLNLLPECDFERGERHLLESAERQPKSAVRRIVADWLPARLADALLGAAKIIGDTPMAHLSRDARRLLVRSIVEWPLPVRDSRGYTYAEATAGGVALDEIDAATMESRVRRGLYLVGEIVDVDGRIGGFNFQWAWSSGLVCGRSLAASLSQNRDNS